MDPSFQQVFFVKGRLFTISFLTILSLIRSTFTDNHEGFGSIDLFEVDSYQHEVEIVPHPVREQKDNINHQDDQTVSLVLIAKHGQRYRCLIPDSQLDLNGLSDDNNGEQTTSNIPELLQPLADKCLVTNEGWWSYKYCHGIGISQFHFEGGQVVGDIVYLGYYDSETVWTEDSLRKAMEVRIKNKRLDSNVMKLPSHDVYYSNGTICDLTGKSRSANVKLTCSPYHTSSEIITVVEENTCNYSVLIHTPFLCDHPLFIPESKFGRSVIQCAPILSENKYEQYMKSISKRVKASPSLSVGELTPKIDTKEEIRDDTGVSVPLMSLLETLANSLVKEITVEYDNKENNDDSNEKDEEKADLDTFIENIVTDSLNEVFGQNKQDGDSSSDTDDGELHSRNSFPEEIKSAKTGNEASLSQGMNQSPIAGEERPTVVDSKKTNAERNNNLDDHGSSASDGPHSFNSVLAIMLQEILNDGFLQSENTSANKNDHKLESKRKTLEERYRSTWEPAIDEENSPPPSSATTSSPEEQ